MTLNIQEEAILARDALIFKTHLTGVGVKALAERHKLSYGRVDKIITEMTEKIVEYLKDHNLPMPVSTARVDRVQDSAFWNAALDQYFQECTKKPNLTIHDPVLKIGITEKFASRLEEMEIKNIGDLLETLKTTKQRIMRMFNGNETSMNSLERKLRQAGFDPAAGREQ